MDDHLLIYGQKTLIFGLFQNDYQITAYLTYWWYIENLTVLRWGGEVVNYQNLEEKMMHNLYILQHKKCLGKQV